LEEWRNRGVLVVVVVGDDIVAFTTGAAAAAVLPAAAAAAASYSILFILTLQLFLFSFKGGASGFDSKSESFSLD
jgi:hypothetical protein